MEEQSKCHCILDIRLWQRCYCERLIWEVHIHAQIRFLFNLVSVSCVSCLLAYLLLIGQVYAIIMQHIRFICRYTFASGWLNKPSVTFPSRQSHFMEWNERKGANKSAIVLRLIHSGTITNRGFIYEEIGCGLQYGCEMWSLENAVCTTQILHAEEHI